MDSIQADFLYLLKSKGYCPLFYLIAKNKYKIHSLGRKMNIYGKYISTNNNMKQVL
jgi:hypothetical protein